MARTSACSTPDGIEEDFTAQGVAVIPVYGMCSTPDGIEEDFTAWMSG